MLHERSRGKDEGSRVEGRQWQIIINSRDQGQDERREDCGDSKWASLRFSPCRCVLTSDPPFSRKLPLNAVAGGISARTPLHRREKSTHRAPIAGTGAVGQICRRKAGELRASRCRLIVVVRNVPAGRISTWVTEDMVTAMRRVHLFRVELSSGQWTVSASFQASCHG